jgi:salicylate hydroxylase
VTLWNGEKQSGDLVIAADGVHTKAVEAVLGYQNSALPTQECNFAYRFLIPSKDIAEDPETARFLEDDDGRIKFLVMEGKRLVWYPCRK